MSGLLLHRRLETDPGWDHLNALYARLGIQETILLLSILLYLLLLVPTMLVSARLTVATQAVMIERLGPLESIRRSWQLTWGATWRLVGYNLLIWLLLALLVTFPLEIITRLALMRWSIQRLKMFFAITVAIAQCLKLPFNAIATTLIYDDLRVRREGRDLERQISVVLPAGSAPAAD